MAVNNEKVFSGLVYLPKGRADDTVIEGCIVLEGGAFRGVYGEGVLDALMEAGINMQTTIGNVGRRIEWHELCVGTNWTVGPNQFGVSSRFPVRGPAGAHTQRGRGWF